MDMTTSVLEFSQPLTYNMDYSAGRFQKRSDPVQCRDKGWKSGKEKVVYRHSHPQE